MLSDELPTEPGLSSVELELPESDELLEESEPL